MKKRIVVDENWRAVDTLDGRELKHGEMLKIWWPDGKWSIHRIGVERGSYPYSDMGVPTTIPWSKSFIRLRYRGALVRVYLRDSKKFRAERIGRE